MPFIPNILYKVVSFLIAFFFFIFDRSFTTEYITEKVSYLVMNGIIPDCSQSPTMGEAESKPKAARKPRAKKVEAVGDAKPRQSIARASRAKPKAAADDDLGNVAMPELTREPSFATLSFPSNAERKAEADAEAAKVKKAVAKAKKAVPEHVDLALSPKWVKFRGEVAEGKYDDMRGDAFHPGKLSVQVSKLLVAHPELRTLVRDLLESRGRDDVKKIFGL